MERLIISIPEKKSILVKQVLKDLGVTIHQPSDNTSSLKQKLKQISVWTNDELTLVEVGIMNH